jgi:predicted DNA-binding transcriptional regulator YafY
VQLLSRPPLARIARIDQVIRDGAMPNARTLASELEVSPRTVQRDLEFLRDRLHAPLQFDPVRNGYRYTKTDYCLPFFRLTEGELVALFLAERVLRQYHGTPFEADLQRAFARMTGDLAGRVSVNLAALAEVLSVTPTVTAAQELGTFRALSAAVLARRRLQLEYWTASRDEVTRRQVDPYHLTLIDHDWYLVAYCHWRQAVRMFSVVRVRAVKDTGQTFDRPADFCMADYMGGSFRAVRGTGGGRRHDVVLRFPPGFAGRIAEKSWHSSQRTERTADGGIILRLEVAELVEVKRWVLFWGADCEVLEPPELRRQVAEEVKRMAAYYGEQATNAEVGQTDDKTH